MNNYYSKSFPFIIKAITNIHVGSGGSIESGVDLPFQRDELGFPTIYASSLKGSFKSHLLKVISDNWLVKKGLGFEEGDEEEEASNIGFLDALLLGIPARYIGDGSDRYWVYVTAESIKEKLCNYLKALSEISDVTEEDVCKNSTTNNNATPVILNEEYVTDYSKIVFEGYEIYVLKDLIAKAIIEKSMIKARRIKIDRTTKTVVRGGLWTEEYAPSNTLFFSAFLVKPDRPSNHLSYMIYKKVNYLIIGGKETIGKGIGEIIWIPRTVIS
ncbi:type III-B CRISPR module RAMP protein Cmr4 [Sulfolobus sp. E5-1-F]|uniref:type III-B CRISPR module RAMP protein Cmr4 n=1 Tax=Saccharolobus sp. E5-1-F TaxID=2663019 RepID=UPI001296DE7E|nr:type III-B CRISPR module RAMP protein Cmr4 [Sulfolobus sp. E5-1-F]QGA53822.1 type III-B CRISPR module RAMP protein Cmr4 [Sulfolobus sp. E5-1-F]